jgi:hypothetical protein
VLFECWRGTATKGGRCHAEWSVRWGKNSSKLSKCSFTSNKLHICIKFTGNNDTNIFILSSGEYGRHAAHHK